MKPSAIRIERMLEKIEARLVPPPRKVLQVIIDEGDDQAAAMEKALAKHVACHPQDAGRTVEDFNWTILEFVVRRHPTTGEMLSRACSRYSASEPGETSTSRTDASETLRTGLDQAGSTPELDGKGGPHHNHEPIDLLPPDPGFLARSKPWRPVHQRPVHQRNGSRRYG